MAVSEQDFAFEDDAGLVRQLRYAPNELALLDISSEVTVMNWTSHIAPRSFLSLVDDITDLPENEAELYVCSEYFGEVAGINNVRAVPDELMNSCQFMRIDLNKTRSVTWELVDLGDQRVPLVAYGDDTILVASGDVGFVEKLLYTTASRAVDPHEILTSMTTLARQYGYGTATAGSGLSI